jgi:hypothetical protein
MSVSRRRFLKSGAIVSAALVLKPATFALGQNSRSARSVNPHSAHLYNREMFERHVGDVFRVRAGKQMINLKLVALENVAPASRGITTGRNIRTDCFSLRFHASKPLLASAGMHQLSHEKLGKFDLFLTQSSTGSKITQTAIVNHLA